MQGCHTSGGVSLKYNPCSFAAIHVTKLRFRAWIDAAVSLVFLLIFYVARPWGEPIALWTKINRLIIISSHKILSIGSKSTSKMTKDIEQFSRRTFLRLFHGHSRDHSKYFHNGVEAYDNREIDTTAGIARQKRCIDGSRKGCYRALCVIQWDCRLYRLHILCMALWRRSIAYRTQTACVYAYVTFGFFGDAISDSEGGNFILGE